MSVTFANKVIAGLRSYGVTVHLLTDYAKRGNGQTSAYVGGIMHHTATPYGMAPPVLWNGRPDLYPPLCNSAGNEDGSVTIVAAHPANHAGASGGRSMGPLPITSSFNKVTWGHEIVYPGTKPMTSAQYRTMIILGRVITDILGRPNAEWIRGHYETSVTGKWDPGYAPNKTIDLRQMRTDINNFKGGDDLKDDERGWLADLHMAVISGVYTQHKKEDAKINRDLGWVMSRLGGNIDSLETRVAALSSQVNAIAEKLNQLQVPVVDVDEAAIAEAISAQINVGDLDPVELQTAVEQALVNVYRKQWNK